jgi:hypothetical protein
MFPIWQWLRVGPPHEGDRVMTPMKGGNMSRFSRHGGPVRPRREALIVMRSVLVVALLSCAPATVSRVEAGVSSDDGSLVMRESPTEQSITEGETTLVVDPDTAYRTLADYARWTTVFPDIREVIVTRRSGDDARITFVHRDGKRDNVHFRNQPAARMVWFEDTGGRAQVWAEIVFVPGDRPGTTRVHSRLYAAVHGIASLFVDDDRLRALREQRIRADLLHVRDYFACRVSAAP